MRRSSTTRRGANDDIDQRIERAVRNVIGQVAQEERDRRDPAARQNRLNERLERFLDGFEQAVEEEGRPRGQRRPGEDDDEDDEDDEPGVIELLAGLGGGGRGRR